MKRSWSIATATDKSFEEVAKWIMNQPGWVAPSECKNVEGQSRTVVHFDQIFYLILIKLDPKRGTANDLRNHLGVLPTLLLDINAFRAAELIGKEDIVYRLAFQFEKAFGSPLLFRQDYEVVFVLDSDSMRLKEDYFLTESLASLLPPSYEVCDFE